ncbi:MAG: peptidoglycan DD-metalloendopeptidase family protein [Anaerolineales bacterium]|nr:peptidoglycan DD-metalloendopeptidase family protein [Anaerolineales bacterium]
MKTLRLLLAASLLLAAAPPAARAQDTAPTNGPTYVVQPGDTLFAIARQFGVTLEALQAANPTVNANALQVGATLVIPGYAQVQGPLLTHFVEAGETLSSLVPRFGMERATLVKLNRLVNPDRVFINQPLVLVATPEFTPLENGFSVSVAAGQSALAELAARNQKVWAVAGLNRKANASELLAQTSWRLTGGATPLKALPPLFREFTLRPTPFFQGGMLAVKVVTEKPVQISGALGRWKMAFNSDPAQPNTYYGLLAVYRLAEPNLYPLVLTATVESEVVGRFAQDLPVRAGEYGSDPPLTVPPETLDPANIQPEFEKIMSVVSQNSPVKMWNGLFVLPSVGSLRSLFGSLRSYNGGPYDSFHGGVDFSGGDDRPITAPAPGVVVLAEPLTVRGNSVIVDHGWGVFTGYWHQSRMEVQVGQKIETGQIIGYNGSTGRVTGPHLHWEVFVASIQTDPLIWTETEFP